MTSHLSSVESLCSGSGAACIPAPFETARLVLRPFEERDIPRMARIEADPEVTKWTGGIQSDVAAAKSVRYMKEAFASRKWGTLAVTLRNENECIGYCGVRPLTNTPDVELAFGLERIRWGFGYATEAARTTLEVAFNHLPIDSVVGTVYQQNSASIRVLTKLGMSYEKAIFGVWPQGSALLYRLHRSAWRNDSC
jgi:RimJ/RimL family protein N-acetyltransferase